MKEKYTAMATVAILLLTVFAISNFPLANSQLEQPLPVLLIHGYFFKLISMGNMGRATRKR